MVAGNLWTRTKGSFFWAHLVPVHGLGGQLLLGTSGARSWSGRPRSLGKKSNMDGCDTAPHSALPAEVGTAGLITGCIRGRQRILSSLFRAQRWERSPLSCWRSGPHPALSSSVLLIQQSFVSWVIGMTAVGRSGVGHFPSLGPDSREQLPLRAGTLPCTVLGFLTSPD